MSLLATAAALAPALPAAPPAGEAAARDPAVETTAAFDEVQGDLDRAIDWLLAHQADDGSWGRAFLDGLAEFGFSIETYYAWKVAAHSLVCMALMEAPETPERRAALERGLAWLCETRAPKRGNHWDADYVWSGLYGTVAAVRAARDPRFAEGDWPERIERAGRAHLGILLRNQSPEGGWGYYDDPPWSLPPSWATSFTTALVLPALRDALELGWLEEARVLGRAQRYVLRCSLPNGAYSYDLRPVPRHHAGESIDQPKGSLGRIQVCNWGLAASGVQRVTHDRIRAGLEAFFRHHRFLDVARMRPIPHEAYYYNSGYFYFFAHYYAALAIELLPEDERETWHVRLRPHVVRGQRADGSSSDFLHLRTDTTASTAYVVLALSAGAPRPVE